MNRPLTTVELLQQGPSLHPHVTTSALKRTIQSYESEKAYTTTTVAYSLQGISGNTCPRKRQKSGSREAVYLENRESFQPRTKTHSRTPSKRSRVSANENGTDSFLKREELSRPATKFSLVLISFQRC